MTRKLLAVLLIGLLSTPSLVRAQDRPVVFVHGMNGVHSWDNAADRLRHRLAITPFVPALPWQQHIETQVNHLQGLYASLPATTIAVGHSNGGIVSRKWSTVHPLSGTITLGSPQQGAPIADHVVDILNFNSTLYNYMGMAGSSIGIQPNQWNFVFLFVQGALIFGQGFALESFLQMSGILGMQLGMPVLPQISTGSYLLSDLNSSGNLARESAEIPARVGLAYVAHNYWQAGVARAARPHHADEIYAQMVTAIATLEIAASYLWANYPGNSWALTMANSFYYAANWLRQADPFWCWAVTNDASCNTPHDGVVPFWSQIYPGAVNYGIGGPAHIEENKVSDDALVYVLTTHANVLLRSAAPPPPSGPSGSATLSHGECLTPGQYLISDDGRFELFYQGDGNLVLYRTSDGAALWNTATFSVGQACMQGDGNLVVTGAGGNALWHSSTHGYPGAYLVLQNDGNLVIYDYYGYYRWASGTYQ